MKIIGRCSKTGCMMFLFALLTGCDGGAGFAALIAGLSGGSAATVPLVVFPGQETDKPAALLPFTAEVRALAITPDGAKLYAADTLHNTVSVIDTATRRTTKVLDAMGTGPRFIAVTPDGRKALVAHFGTVTFNNLSVPDNTVAVIDTSTDAVTATVTVGRAPFAIAVTPNNAKAYVANSADDTVSVIALGNDTVTATLNVGTQPVAIAITRDGGRAFVANRGSDNVTVIDVATDQVTGTLAVGDAPTALALHPDDTFLYVTNRGDGASAGTVSVIDVASGAVRATLNVGTGPVAAVASPDGGRVYVAHSFNGREDDVCGLQSTPQRSVRVIDAATQTVLPGEIAVGDAPLALLVTGDGNKLYAISGCSDAATDEGSVSVVNTSAITTSAAVTPTNVSLPSRATAAVLAPNSSRLYIAHPQAVSVLNVTGDDLIGTPIPVRGDGPTKLALAPGGTKLYAIRPGANAVAVLDVNVATGMPQLLGNVAVGDAPSDVRIADRAVGTDQVYVTNAGHSRFAAASVSVLDVTGPGAIDDTPATISLLDQSGFPVLGAGPLSLAFSADASRVYAAVFGDFFSNDPATHNLGASVARMNGQVDHFLTNNNGGGYVDVGVDAATDALYVAEFTGGQILREQESAPDADPDFFVAVDTPMGIAIADQRAYTASYRVDAQDRTVVTQIDGNLVATQTLPGANPGRIAATPNGGALYVLHSGDRQFRCGNGTRYCDTGNTVSVITLPFAGAPGTASLTVGAHPAGIAFTPVAVAPQRALVTNYYDGTVSVIAPWALNGTTPAVTGTVAVGAGPRGVVVNGAGTRAYVANSVSNSISVIDVSTGAVLGTVSLSP